MSDFSFFFFYWGASSDHLRHSLSTTTEPREISPTMFPHCLEYSSVMALIKVFIYWIWIYERQKSCLILLVLQCFITMLGLWQMLDKSMLSKSLSEIISPVGILKTFVTGTSHCIHPFIYSSSKKLFDTLCSKHHARSPVCNHEQQSGVWCQNWAHFWVFPQCMTVSEIFYPFKFQFHYI